MPVVEATVTVPIAPDVAFAVSQSVLAGGWRFAPAGRPGHTLATWPVVLDTARRSG